MLTPRRASLCPRSVRLCAPLCCCVRFYTVCAPFDGAHKSVVRAEVTELTGLEDRLGAVDRVELLASTMNVIADRGM